MEVISLGAEVLVCVLKAPCQAPDPQRFQRDTRGSLHVV